MLRSKTLFILGAGSSKDFGFPLGPDLTDQIAAALTFDFSSHEISGGDEASSVDRFIESNQDDQDVVEICKFAI